MAREYFTCPVVIDSVEAPSHKCQSVLRFYGGWLRTCHADAVIGVGMPACVLDVRQPCLQCHHYTAAHLMLRGLAVDHVHGSVSQAPEGDTIQSIPLITVCVAAA
jgi:hypothetical protein